jgi:release factor family 10
VLSIYVDGASTARYRGTAIDIDNRLVQLERSVTADGSPLVAEALSGTLRRIAPVVERLPDPGTSGRGRVLFASLSNRELTLVSSGIRVNNRVVLDSTPFIHPLLELIDEGRPAGVVLTSARSADLLDWRLGNLCRVSHVRAGPALPGGERSGADVANASRTPRRELQARRERETHRAFVDQVAGEAARLARGRSWERILIAGERRLTRPLFEALPNWLSQNAVLDSRHLTEVDGPVLAIAVADRLASERAERHIALARRIRDAALGAGRGALGLSEVLSALNDGRVEHLIYDPEVRYTGALGEDDLLLGPSETVGTVVQESRLTERIVERCLLTAARITPLDAAAAETLADAGGIAALLRW